MKIKKVIDIGVDNLIKLIDNISLLDKYYQPQIEIKDENKMADFLIFCEKLSEYYEIHQLGGRNGLRRYVIDKKLNDVIHKSHTSIACGIKVIKNPLSNMFDRDKWDGGYIELMSRMNSDTKNVEWFVWQYIKMDKLKIILKEFENDLYFYDFYI